MGPEEWTAFIDTARAFWLFTGAIFMALALIGAAVFYSARFVKWAWRHRELVAYPLAFAAWLALWLIAAFVVVRWIWRRLPPGAPTTSRARLFRRHGGPALQRAAARARSEALTIAPKASAHRVSASRFSAS